MGTNLNISSANSTNTINRNFLFFETENTEQKTSAPKPKVPTAVNIKTKKGEDPRELHRRYLMEAASEAGLDGTEQQKEFVKKYLVGMVFKDKTGDPSPEDNDLKVKSGDLENEWRAYELSNEEIADLKRLQNEFVKSGGILKRGKTYERTSEGESSSLEQKGANLKRPLPNAQYEARKLRELWEKAQILPTSAFGTPSKLRDLKHISINVSSNTTADQTDSILSDYIESRYGDRSNLWGDDKADILKIAKTNGVKIENVSVENGKAEFDMSVESLLKLHIAYIGVQEKANITEAAVKDQQWNSAYNQFLVGIGEGAWENLKDTGKLITDPVGTLKGIYEAAKTAGSIALELVKMSDAERGALFAQLAKAGIKGLGEMPLNEAARHVGNFIGRLAVDAALGKGIGTAFSLIKDLKIGAKIIKETVDLSKKIKQTLGNVKVPLSDMKVVSDAMGNKWLIREGELKSLEEIIKPLESRASQTLSGVKKAINLPAWNKLSFKLENDGKTIHFLNNHTVNGKGYLQSIAGGGRKDVFPAGMNDKQIFKAVREAYENSKKVGTQVDPISGDKIVELVGYSSDGMKIRMYVNLTLKQLDTAFPQ